MTEASIDHLGALENMDLFIHEQYIAYFRQKYKEQPLHA